jgi:hypothetical protein
MRGRGEASHDSLREFRNFRQSTGMRSQPNPGCLTGSVQSYVTATRVMVPAALQWVFGKYLYSVKGNEKKIDKISI